MHRQIQTTAMRNCKLNISPAILRGYQIFGIHEKRNSILKGYFEVWSSYTKKLLEIDISVPFSKPIQRMVLSFGKAAARKYSLCWDEHKHSISMGQALDVRSSSISCFVAWNCRWTRLFQLPAFPAIPVFYSIPNSGCRIPLSISLCQLPGGSSSPLGESLHFNWNGIK